jgi:hypothetical protein
MPAEEALACRLGAFLQGSRVGRSISTTYTTNDRKRYTRIRCAYARTDKKWYVRPYYQKHDAEALEG